ncbi:acyltransferase 3 [Aspergillus minisclerotigenes]|uniref:Acyltransferase 3 n=1 Tax=Aspergillus minisclerotigenes TaxID=656917 RepID=A0A5N6JDM6_9EURO|nr:acyltransferase 3 [Aspergillus minisclerotigenes]
MAQPQLFRRVLDAAHRLYLAFLPSFVRDQLQGRQQPPTKIHATTYLDGFRGVMSLLVFVRHFLLPWFPRLDHGFGQEIGDESLFQLPVIRILYSGPNVPIFLIVSGYLVSLKPINLMREGKSSLVWESLASSTFRRAFRIFPTPLFSSFIVMLLVQLGMFDYPYTSLPGHIPTHPKRLQGIIQQFLDWLRFVFYDLTNPWTWSTHLPFAYGAHLWTIPLQFRCSLVLFVTMLGLLQLSISSRTLALLSLTVFTLTHGRWDVALYLGGMGLAEYDLARRQKATVLPPSPISRDGRLIRCLSFLGWLILLGSGLYLSSFPRYRGITSATGYQWLYNLTNDYHYWHAYGATLLVCYTGHSQTSQWLFTRGWAQYLGRLSFCLYVVHEPLLHVLGYRSVELAWRLTGNDTPSMYHLGIAAGFLMTTPVLLWLADLLCYWVDRPIGNMVQWIERTSKRK